MTTDGPLFMEPATDVPMPPALVAAIQAAEEAGEERHDFAAPPPDPLPEPASPPPPTAAPLAPIAAGTYAVYEDGAGGFMFVIAPREGGTFKHHVPAAMVKMAARFGGLDITKLLGGS